MWFRNKFFFMISFFFWDKVWTDCIKCYLMICVAFGQYCLRTFYPNIWPDYTCTFHKNEVLMKWSQFFTISWPIMIQRHKTPPNKMLLHNFGSLVLLIFTLCAQTLYLISRPLFVSRHRRTEQLSHDEFTTKTINPGLVLLYIQLWSCIFITSKND